MLIGSKIGAHKNSPKNVTMRFTVCACGGMTGASPALSTSISWPGTGAPCMNIRHAFDETSSVAVCIPPPVTPPFTPFPIPPPLVNSVRSLYWSAMHEHSPCFPNQTFSKNMYTSRFGNRNLTSSNIVVTSRL
jgi:hypothetical protein